MKLVVGATLLGVFLFCVPNLNSSMEWISIKVDNLSTYDHTFEYKDAVADTTHDLFVGGKSQKVISIQSNGQVYDGYGEIKFHLKGNESSRWSVRMLLRDGDGPVHLN